MSYYGVDYPNYYLAHYRTKGATNKRHKYVAIRNGQYIYDTPTDRAERSRAFDKIVENSPGSEKNYGNRNAKSPNVRRPRHNENPQESRDSRVRRNYQYRQMREENEARDIDRERDAAINSAHRHHDQMEREAKNRAERRLQFARIAGRGISRSDVRTSMDRRGEYITNRYRDPSRNGLSTSRGLEGHNDRPSRSQDSMASRRYNEYARAPRNKPGSTHHGETKRPPERKPTYSDRRRRRNRG